MKLQMIGQIKMQASVSITGFLIPISYQIS